MNEPHMIVAERAAQSTCPVCPNCGKASYRRRGKQYRCQKCGAGFDQPLKPGRSKAPKKLYYINDWRMKNEAKHERGREQRKARWERKFEEAKARWHEKYGDIPQP